MKILETKELFDAEIATGKTVVDFFAEWCGPCKMMEPFFKEASEEVTDVKFAKLNVDDVQEVAGQFGVTSIPTMIVFENGKEVKRTTGFLPKPKIVEFASK
jgi:thioredoxin 1